MFFNFTVFAVSENATSETLHDVLTWFQEKNDVAIIDGMHLTRQSRHFITSFCTERVYHHLLVEINCDDDTEEDNINDTIAFHQLKDKNVDWQQYFTDKLKASTPIFERCSPQECPLIVVNGSENPIYHSVTARGVQGALQTGILGVLASPVIKHQVFYFSRVS